VSRLFSVETGVYKENAPVAAARFEMFDWWRWRRVELLVQSVQPETTTSVSDALSSIC
jgi:hypothetical protein